MRKPATDNAPSHSCNAFDHPAGRYSRFNCLHGKETPRIFDVSWGWINGGCWDWNEMTKQKKKTNRVLGRVRTRASCLLGEWYSQGQRPQLVSSGYHHHCPYAWVVLHRSWYQQWEELVGI